MMRLSPRRYGGNIPDPTYLALFGFRFAGSQGLYVYEAEAGAITNTDYVVGTTSAPVSIGGGYLTYNGNLYQWAGNALTLIGAVPYGGWGCEYDGTDVKKLTVTSVTATHFNMTRTTYSLAGSVLGTATFSIAKLDGDTDNSLRLFQNNAQYTQMRRNGAGQGNVSAWFDDATQIARPINPSNVGNGTYYSAWAESTSNNNPAVFANNSFYSLEGNVYTRLAKWPSNSGTPTAYYQFATDVAGYHCADADGNIWLTIPNEGQTHKFDADLNLLETFTGTVFDNGGSIAAIVN